MPSREFVERVLSTGSAEEIEGDSGHDEEMSAIPAEAPEEEDTGEAEAPEEEEAEAEAPEALEDAETAEGEEDADGLSEEEDEEPEEPGEPAAEQDDEFYLGMYKTREEAEKGWYEKEQHISRIEEAMHQMRERQAQYEGYLAALNQPAASEPGEFEAWAEPFFEAGQAHAGFQEAMDATEETGDDSYVNAYVEMWKEHDPYEAAVARNRLDMVAAVNWQRAQPAPPPPPQEVANSVWAEVAQSDPELGQNGEYAQGVARILKNSEGLKALMLSNDPKFIREAIRIARDGYRMAARTGNGTPRKVKSSDAERLRKGKLDATVTTGDSAPERRASTPEVPAELQDMMQRISAGEGGFPKLRE